MSRPRITIVRLMAVVLGIGCGLAVLTIVERKNAQIAELSARIQQLETPAHPGGLVDDRPDGHVTKVDLQRRQVTVDIPRRHGARPQMRMSIYECGRNSVPNDEPKGTIELIEVGEEYSIARILQTSDGIDSIHVCDIVYSPAWSRNSPGRFALLGKIDINQDGSGQQRRQMIPRDNRAGKSHRPVSGSRERRLWFS